MEENKLEVNKSVKTNDVPSENKGAVQADSLLSQIGKANVGEEKKEDVKSNEEVKEEVKEEKPPVVSITDEMKKPVMVVKRSLLLGEDDADGFHGFKAAEDIDYASRILNNSEFMERGLAEENVEYKQPISYGVLINRKLNQVLVYQRGKKDTEYVEKRLQGKYSWGVCGHIDEGDKGNPLQSSLLREIEEEFGLKAEQINGLKILGYVNDDSNPVGKVHFGILYVAETDVEIIEPKSESITSKLMSLEGLEKLLADPEVKVETWSEIAMDSLRKHFD